VGECLLPFGSESFVFLPTVQDVKESCSAMPCRYQGERTYSSYSFLPQNQMGMSGQFQALALLTHGIGGWVSLKANQDTEASLISTGPHPVAVLILP
jgi:hypothetical protein